MLRVVITIMLFAWLTLFFLAVKSAYPHDAPSGWAYDPSCCNTVDCRPVDGPDGPRHHTIQVLETAAGYIIKRPDGKEDELIPRSSSKIRESKDAEYHLCTYGGRDAAGSICLYTPFRGL